MVSNLPEVVSRAYVEKYDFVGTKQNIEDICSVKNNVPRYIAVDFSMVEKGKIASTEDVFSISERLIKQNMEAYKVLAK